jgi:hypothetical protein
MAIKKYSSGGWSPTTYRRYGTETDILTSLPAQIIGDGQAITSCQISGNTIQDGTPTPDAPVDVKGVGVKTSNLVDWDSFINSINSINGGGSYTATSTSISITSDTSTDAYTSPYNSGNPATYRLKVKPNTKYSVSIEGSGGYQLILWKNGIAGSGYGLYLNSARKFATITTDSETTFYTLRAANTGSLGSTATLSNVMIIEGEYTAQTMPAYEPYGFKLDISSGGRNLFDGELEKGVWDSVSTLVQTTSEVFRSFKRNLPAGTYTLSFPNSVNIVRLIADGTLTQNLATNVNSYTVTTTTDGDIGFSFRLTTSSTTPWDNENVMLNLGSIVLPYEPYNRIATPIYLGEVQSTRKIKKLVLTGNENWVYRSGEPNNVFSVEFVEDRFINNHGLCTHYPNQDSGSFDDLEDKHVLVRFAKNGTKSYIGLRDSSITSTHSEGVSELKEYLAAQYAAGTPVTIWYVLATPETAIVNEPLMKIGDYTDMVAAANIPTTGTPENFDVGTALKPSEVQLTYHGWHEHTDTKYTQGE